MLDEQFKIVTSSSGFEQVGASGTTTIHTKAGIAVNKSGYLYVYTSNDATNIDVFFDNLQVTHIRGAILEETHYYPFGLTMNGISSKALAFGIPQNKYKYNDGNELQSEEFTDGSGLEMYDAKHRMYDPQIGRFWQVDELAEANWEWTPYNFAINNPINFNDPLGLQEEPAENGGKVKELQGVTIIVVPKGFQAQRNLYYQISEVLEARKASPDQIVQPALRNLVNHYDRQFAYLKRVHDMAHESDPYIWGLFLAPIVLVEGAFILTGVQLSAILTRINSSIAEGGRLVKFLSDKKFSKLIQNLNNYLIKSRPINNIKDFERLGRLLKEMEKFRDVSQYMKPEFLKQLKELISKVFNIKI